MVLFYYDAFGETFESEWDRGGTIRRDEYETIINRLKDENRQLRQEVQDSRGEARSYYQEVLEDAGLSLDGGLVRYAANPPADATIAPTWEVQRCAQLRTYEAQTRMADIKSIAMNGIDAVISVHNQIDANSPMHPALENDLREIQEETKKATKYSIAKSAGYDNTQYL